MQFYYIYTDLNVEIIEYTEGTDWVSHKCPVYEGHTRAGKRKGQLRIKYKSKKKFDFISTFLNEIIISDKVASIFDSNQVTGYNLKKVEIICNPFDENFWEFIVTGKGGDAHPDSGIYLKETCKYCGNKVYTAYENGIIVDINNWDGNDIFTVSGYSRHIIVTERVRNIIEMNKLTGISIIPSQDLRWPKNVIRP